VWSHGEGTVRGLTLESLHKAAPEAARRDPALHELLALVDGFRDGRGRERRLAERELTDGSGHSYVTDRNRALFESVVSLLAPGLDELVLVGGCTTSTSHSDRRTHSLPALTIAKMSPQLRWNPEDSRELLSTTGRSQLVDG
jgi:hypothetical protein